MSVYFGGQELRRPTKKVTCFCSMMSETSSRRYQGWWAQQLWVGMIWRPYKLHVWQLLLCPLGWGTPTCGLSLCGLGFYTPWWPWDNWISYWNSTEIEFLSNSFFMEAQCSKSQCSRKKRWKLSHLLWPGSEVRLYSFCFTLSVGYKQLWGSPWVID